MQAELSAKERTRKHSGEALPKQRNPHLQSWRHYANRSPDRPGKARLRYEKGRKEERGPGHQEDINAPASEGRRKTKAKEKKVETTQMSIDG